MLTAKDYGGDYEIFRQKIDEYWRAVGPQGEHDFVEEVDHLERGETKRTDGKFNKDKVEVHKGSGKGSAGDYSGNRTIRGQPQCYHCGAKCHLAKQGKEKTQSSSLTLLLLWETRSQRDGVQAESP